MEDKTTKGKSKCKMLRIIIAILSNRYFWFVFFLAMLILAFIKFDIHETESLKEIPVWVIILAISLQTIAQFVLYFQWYFVAKASGIKIKYIDMCYINSQGYIVESVTPGAKIGGEITRAIQIKNFGKCDLKKAASAVALQKLFSIGVFVIITITCVIYMITKSLFHCSTITKIAIHCLPALILCFILIMFIFPRTIKNRYFINNRNDEKPHKVKEFMANLLDTIISVRNRPSVWIPILLLCMFDWFIYPLNIIILSKQIMPCADILFLTGAVFVSYMVAMLPIFPGGLGGFEPTLTGLLVIGCFDLPDALCIAIVFRLISFWFTILLSSITIGLYKIFHGGKNEPQISKINSEQPHIS